MDIAVSATPASAVEPPLPQSVEDAASLLAAAAALGVRLDAPAGLRIYVPIVTTNGARSRPAVYGSYEGALSAIRDWVIHQFVETRYYRSFSPWTKAELTFEEWYVKSSDREIIDAYFGHYTDEEWTVDVRFIHSYCPREEI